MTGKQASSEGPPPPSPDAGAEPSARPDRPSHARLLEWQGPAFWMSCGALLAGLAAGAVVLAQRVGVERDLMAVATTLPQSEAKAQLAPAPGPAARRQEEPSPQPAAAPKPVPSAMEGPSAESTAAQAKPSRRRGTQHHSTVQLAARKKSVTHRKSAENVEKYAEVFKRCPRPGEPGAVDCRRHICNGAESEGPACKPYRPRPGSRVR